MEADFNHFERRSDQPLIVVDRTCRVLLHSGTLGSDDAREFVEDGRLSEKLASIARSLIARLGDERARSVVSLPTAAIPWIVRLRALHVVTERELPLGECFSLSIEVGRNRDHVSEARRRFGLTRRESEVLSEVLHGASSGEIARKLNLTEGTVQGYYKRLLQRTDTRNRATMIAVVLGWESPVVSSTRAL